MPIIILAFLSVTNHFFNYGFLKSIIYVYQDKLKISVNILGLLCKMNPKIR